MRLFPLLVVALLVGLFLWWFLRTPPQQVVRVLRRALLWLGGGLLIFLAASGRLPSLFALVGALAPFVQRILRLLQLAPLAHRLLLLLRRQRAAAGPAGGQVSRVRTRFLAMALDHDTGSMSGEVLEGSFQGRRLVDLDLVQLLALHRECAADPPSVAVLEAWLDRERGADWRAQARAGPAPEAPAAGPMTRAQAYEILGLPPGAGEQEVLAAHRRLMQRLHPDRGGSNWLAAQINRAKDLLLGSEG